MKRTTLVAAAIAAMVLGQATPAVADVVPGVSVVGAGVTIAVVACGVLFVVVVAGVSLALLVRMARKRRRDAAAPGSAVGPGSPTTPPPDPAASEPPRDPDAR